VPAKLRRAYAWAGRLNKRQLLDQAVSWLGYHRKAAIRALRARPAPPRPPGLLPGRPRTYHPNTLLPIVKPIGFAALQPCGLRLRALLPQWLPAYEADHRRLDADLRHTLLSASPRTLDRWLRPLRVAGRRRTGTRPGSLLRQSIAIRGEWTETGPGWLEVDTVALCGGCLDDRHLWMLDAVDIRTDRCRPARAGKPQSTLHFGPNPRSGGQPALCPSGVWTATTAESSSTITGWPGCANGLGRCF
jgi:hypothetical protein